MNTGNKLAIIADIHGNLAALRAVLDDIAAQGIEAIYNLGDSVYGPLQPGLTAQCLIDAGIHSICGNQDRVLLNVQSESNPTFDYVLNDLNEQQLQWLSSLSQTMIIASDIYACHGSPHADDVSLIEKITPDGVKRRSDEELTEMLQDIRQNVIVCAHTHIPQTYYLPDGRLLINPGSVGLPAYDDDLPYKHVMESHSPHAKYVVIENQDAGWRITHHQISYDWETAACEAESRQRSDWAYALRTGKAHTNLI